MRDKYDSKAMYYMHEAWIEGAEFQQCNIMVYFFSVVVVAAALPTTPLNVWQDAKRSSEHESMRRHKSRCTRA